MACLNYRDKIALSFFDFIKIFLSYSVSDHILYILFLVSDWCWYHVWFCTYWKNWKSKKSWLGFLTCIYRLGKVINKKYNLGSPNDYLVKFRGYWGPALYYFYIIQDKQRTGNVALPPLHAESVKNS